MLLCHYFALLSAMGLKLSQCVHQCMSLYEIMLPYVPLNIVASSVICYNFFNLIKMIILLVVSNYDLITTYFYHNNLLCSYFVTICSCFITTCSHFVTICSYLSHYAPILSQYAPPLSQYALILSQYAHMLWHDAPNLSHYVPILTAWICSLKYFDSQHVYPSVFSVTPAT